LAQYLKTRFTSISNWHGWLIFREQWLGAAVSKPGGGRQAAARQSLVRRIGTKLLIAIRRVGCALAGHSGKAAHVKVEGQLPPDLKSQLSLFFQDSYVSLNFVDGVLEHDEFKQEQVCFHDECLPNSWMCRQCAYPAFRTVSPPFRILRRRIGILLRSRLTIANVGAGLGMPSGERPSPRGSGPSGTQLSRL
jgi:hypothetical protein